MPLFSKKSKILPRKKLEFNYRPPPLPKEDDPIVIDLQGEKFEFNNGQWIQSEVSQLKEHIHRLNETAQNLKEKNNLLEIKVEILLDMLTLKTAKDNIENYKTKTEEVTRQL